MALELKSTRAEFELADESGYKFKVIAEQNISGEQRGSWHEGSWRAEVTFSTAGFKTQEGSVLHLISAAEAFVRMLKEARNQDA